MAVLDLKDAYYSVSIAEEHRHYLRFVFMNQLLEYVAFPNGLASAPRLFIKLMKPVYSTLRSKATWYEKGEKNNKYFLGLEKSRNMKNCIWKLVNKHGQTVTNGKATMTELRRFFEDLYDNKDSGIDNDILYQIFFFSYVRLYYPFLHLNEH